MTIGADERIGESLGDAALFLRPDRLREIFEVHLMANAGAGRHHAEIREGAGAPAQELVALLVALVFEIGVDLERARASEAIDHHGVVDDEIDRHERIDLGGVAMKGVHRVAHRSQIHHGGHAVKSCISTRAGLKAISRVELLLASHCAMARMSSAVTVLPSSKRRRFSRRTFSE